MQQKTSKNDDIVYELSRTARCFNCDQKLIIGELVKIVQGNTSEFSDEREREVRCLNCADLKDMQIVKPGNAKLTRLSKKYSTQYYLIMKWSDLWKTYERTGVLAERAAVQKAEAELAS